MKILLRIDGLEKSSPETRKQLGIGYAAKKTQGIRTSTI
jgi:hypothetical protein